MLSSIWTFRALLMVAWMLWACLSVLRAALWPLFVDTCLPTRLQIFRRGNLLARTSSCASVLLCGDFNALSGLWGSSCTNAAGRLISGLVSDLDLVPLNDSLPTFLAGPGLSRNNLDLIFLSSSLFHLAACRVGDDSFGSDYLPVFCTLDTTLQHVRSGSRRFNIKILDWPCFRARCDDLARELLPKLESLVDPSLIFEAFLSGVSAALEACGAYRPSSLRGQRKAQPLWWNPQCDAALERRKSKYLRSQTRLGKAEFRRVDGKVKRFLRSRKVESFRAYCDSLSPSSGLGKIWRTVRSMCARRVSRCSGATNSLDSLELRALQDELVRPQCAPVGIPRIETTDESDPMVAPFSSREFSVALASCGARTSPGLDGIEYRVVRGLSSFSLEFLLAVYNRMFRDSSLPESWRNTLVVFIPKTGTGKLRPISLTSALCNLFERLLQRRVENMAEHGDWIPPNQYGFRRGRSSLDCVAAVVCDVLAGFGAGQSSFALALDLNGAFNAVLPGELFRQLRDLGLPGRLINFVSFLTVKRNLFFSASDGSPRVCGVGVPQGGVLSPILFNLHLRFLNEHLPPDVRAAMYADDLLLYVRGSDAVRALGLLESAVESVTP